MRPGRLTDQAQIEAWGPNTREDRVYKYIRETVAATNPDLILVSGDIVYGEFDDDGHLLKEFVQFMEGFDMKAVSRKLGINSTSALGLLSTLATCVTAFSNMKEMDEKGAMLNSAFSVSAAFVFGGHLAFTLSFNAEYVVGMIIGKLIAGFGALFVAALLYKFLLAKKQKGGSSTQVETED